MSGIPGFRSAAVLSAVLLLAGCGAGIGDVVDAAAAAKPTPSGSAAPTPTPSDDGSPARRYLTSDQLDEALVGEDAFPAGWQTLPATDTTTMPGEGPIVIDKPECAKATELLDIGNAGIPRWGPLSIVAMSLRGRALSRVTVAAFGAGDAGRLIERVREVLPRCATFSSTQDGKKFTQETTSVPPLRLGDEAYAMAVVTRPPAGSATSGWAHTAAVVRVGDVLIETTYVNLDGPSPEMPDEDLLRSQVDRVKAALAGKPLPPG
ncbi:hypothetical protein ACU686_28200 [Yinghuangia aomiensis]